MNESINDGGVCRTAPATPGLLMIWHEKGPASPGLSCRAKVGCCLGDVTTQDIGYIFRRRVENTIIHIGMHSGWMLNSHTSCFLDVLMMKPAARKELDSGYFQRQKL